MDARLSSAAFGELLIEDRAVPRRVLTNRFDEGHVRSAATAAPALQADALLVFVPRRQVSDQFEPERTIRREDAVDLR